VKLLLSKEQVDVNAFNEEGNTRLHFATEQGSLEIVKMLLARPEINLAEISKRLYTPLVKAIRLNHTEIARLPVFRMPKCKRPGLGDAASKIFLASPEFNLCKVKKRPKSSHSVQRTALTTSMKDSEAHIETIIRRFKDLNPSTSFLIRPKDNVFRFRSFAAFESSHCVLALPYSIKRTASATPQFLCLNTSLRSSGLV
jgi:hypothetical protein